ncbi:MAG TPA: hypothetical protein HPP66_06795 [Planctomycetes bacterium]|nr:hypothetical protein [Planctomycetota bacterium]
MSVKSREAKVFAALALSMTAGVIILKALGNNPPSAGAFCLSDYTKVVPVEEAIEFRAGQSAVQWGRIEIYYSGTKAGNIQQLAFLSGLAEPEDINCHFVICNGLGGGDGQIQTSEKWQNQWLVNHKWTNDEPRAVDGVPAIYICVIAEGKPTRPTNLQIKRTEALVEQLCRKFDIQSESIHYPNDW